MTYTLRETSPDPDHDSSEIALEVFGSLTPEEFASGMQEEAKPMVQQFDVLWARLHNEVQWPVQCHDEQFGGFTGHRIVTFEGNMGRAALGFQIRWNGSDNNRSIVASRRKIYPDDDRRQDYISDELIVRSDKMDYRNAALQFDLGVMAVWLDLFNDAE